MRTRGRSRSSHLPNQLLPTEGDPVMCKKFCFCAATVLAALWAVNARAADDLLSSKIDLSSVRDADNTVVEAKFGVDVGALVQKTSAKSDKNEEAIEACCRSYGCCRSCCYSSCYCPRYSCCYSS